MPSWDNLRRREPQPRRRCGSIPVSQLKARNVFSSTRTPRTSNMKLMGCARRGCPRAEQQARWRFHQTTMAGIGRFCCKSLFALLIKNSLGRRRDFRVKMWGTSSPDGKLTGDLGNAIESTEIDGRRSRRPLAGKLSPGDFRLLQQYRPDPEVRPPARRVRLLG